MRRLLWLTAVWVALWGSVTPANVLGGLAVGAVLLRVLPDEQTPARGPLSLAGLLRFAVVFAGALVRSSLQVAAQVLRPRLALHPAVVAVHVPGTDERLLTLLANSISLTPGTLTLEADRERRLLHVHVLDVGPGARDLPAVRADLTRLERAASRALGGGR